VHLFLPSRADLFLIHRGECLSPLRSTVGRGGCVLEG
jgi:hypothetical protein